MQYEYYYQQLSIIERKIYRTVSDGIKEFKPYVEFKNILDVNLMRIFRAIEYDHPELFYWNGQRIRTKTKGISKAVKLDYYWKQEEVKKFLPKIKQGIDSILSKSKGCDSSEYERFKSIYECMVRNISYDFERAKSKNSEDVAYAHTILGVFAKQKAVCDGISKAFKYVLERAGVDSIVVFGKMGLNGEPHAWNIVWIKDEPCHVDLTWAVENSNTRRINHDYVGLTDAQIKRDHSIDDVLKVPKCDNEELDFYVRNKSAIKSQEELKDYLQKHAKEKPFEINVRLDFKCDIEEMLKKSTDYIIEHYVAKGQYVIIETQLRKEQNIMVIAGK